MLVNNRYHQVIKYHGLWLNLANTTQLLFTVTFFAIMIFTKPDLEQVLQYILRNMHTVFALLCFVVVIHWLIFPYPSGLLHWHCGNLTIAPVPAKQPWWIWINTSCEFIMNDCITTTKQSTTKPCAYFLGYTVNEDHMIESMMWDTFYKRCLRHNPYLVEIPIRLKYEIWLTLTFYGMLGITDAWRYYS